MNALLLFAAVVTHSPPGMSVHRATDVHGRSISYFVDDGPADKPLVLYLQGSGCEPVLVRRDGRWRGSMATLIRDAFAGRARLLVVEKPGAEGFTSNHTRGSAEGCSKRFLEEHSFDRWRDALLAVLDDMDKPVVVVGHSEGALMAAAISAHPRVTHVAHLSGSGLSQRFDLEHLARAGGGERAVQRTRELFARVDADPRSTTAFILGHPHLRWSSFTKESAAELLVSSTSALFIAHGTEDTAVPIASFDALRSELERRGRTHTALVVDGAGHDLRSVFVRVADWFERSS